VRPWPKGLFGDVALLGDEGVASAWRRRPGCANLALRCKRFWRSRKSECALRRVLDLCSIHGESHPGERKLARAFLERIERARSARSLKGRNYRGDSARISRAGLRLCRHPALVTTLTALITRLVPSWLKRRASRSQDSRQSICAPAASPGYAFVNLGSAFLSAAAGGYVTAWAAAANPLIHVLALALVVLALSALSALQSAASSLSVPTSAGGHYAHRRAGWRVGAAEGIGNSVGCAT